MTWQYVYKLIWRSILIFITWRHPIQNMAQLTIYSNLLLCPPVKFYSFLHIGLILTFTRVIFMHLEFCGYCEADCIICYMFSCCQHSVKLQKIAALLLSDYNEIFLPLFKYLYNLFLIFSSQQLRVLFCYFFLNFLAWWVD